MERAKEPGNQLSWITRKKEEIGKLTVKGLSYSISSMIILFVYVFLLTEFESVQNTSLFWIVSLAVLVYAIWVFWRFSSLNISDRRKRCVHRIQIVEEFLAKNELSLHEIKELDFALEEFDNDKDVIFTGGGNLKLTDHFMIASFGEYASVVVIKADMIGSGRVNEEDEGYIDFDFYDADGKAIKYGITLSGEALDKKEQIMNAINTKYGKIISEGSSIGEI